MQGVRSLSVRASDCETEDNIHNMQQEPTADELLAEAIRLSLMGEAPAVSQVIGTVITCRALGCFAGLC